MLDPRRLVEGLQCELRLWRAARREPGARPDRGSASESEWGELRAGLGESFPHSVAAGSAECTHDALEGSAPALRDAVLEHAGARVEVDVLERLPQGTWRAVLLAAHDRPRDPDRERAGLVWFVLQGCGVQVGRIELWIPDASRARGAGAIDWRRFFRRVDVTRDAELLARDAPADVARLGALLGDVPEPEVEPSPHCFRPTRCPYHGECTRALGLDWIGHLPRLRPELFHALRERGARRISEIPDDVALGPEQRAALSAQLGAGTWISPGLAKALASFGPPAAFLDFEAIAPAVPLYPGTRPFQVIPLQWSLRVLDGAGRLQERAFLADPRADPRAAFADALLESAGPPELPVVVYSTFESEVLAGLAEALPGRADRLMRLRARLRDLQLVVRAHAYRGEQRGAYGLKRVLPAFDPSFGWDDLEVRSGADAAETWLALARGELDAVGAARARAALERYCARDTEALDVLLRSLRQVAMRK